MTLFNSKVPENKNLSANSMQRHMIIIISYYSSFNSVQFWLRQSIQWFVSWIKINEVIINIWIKNRRIF